MRSRARWARTSAPTWTTPCSLAKLQLSAPMPPSTSSFPTRSFPPSTPPRSPRPSRRLGSPGSRGGLRALGADLGAFRLLSRRAAQLLAPPPMPLPLPARTSRCQSRSRETLPPLPSGMPSRGMLGLAAPWGRTRPRARSSRRATRCGFRLPTTRCCALLAPLLTPR